jgi:hypothetical protein
MIDLGIPETAVSDILGYVTSVSEQTWGIVAIIIGIGLAFLIIELLIGAFRHK